LFADREGCLWIGTNGGLARWASGKIQQLPATDPLAGASILSLLEDREGNLWVGTETDGLQVLRDARFHNIGTREGLSSDATSTVVEDSAGKIWVGTNGGSLNFSAARCKHSGSDNDLCGPRRAFEQCDSLAGGCEERRFVGRDARWIEPDSRECGRFVHFGRRAARRFYSLTAGGRGWFLMDRHAARACALDIRTPAGRTPQKKRRIRRRTVWAAT
jgi:hypothetical protein